MKRVLPMVALAPCLLAQTASLAPTAWSPQLSSHVQAIGSVIPSPDGRLVAYTQTRFILESEKSEQVTHIYLARADGSHRLQLTRGEKSCTEPSFSPDGRLVYFLSDRSGQQAVWRIPVDGGEAEKLTDFKGSVTGFQLAPNGKSLAFLGNPTDAEEEKAKKEKRDFRVVDDKGSNAWLYLIAAEADATGKRPERKLADVPYHIASLDWSPDSRFIAFEHWPRPEADYWTQADISEVDAESGTVRSIAASKAAESSPQYSPDGRHLAFERTTEPPRWPGEVRLVLMQRQGGALRVLPATYDERPAILGWAADGKKLLYIESKHTRAAVFSMPVDGTPQVVYEPDKGTLAGARLGSAPVRLNSTGTHLGLAREASDEAPEAFVMGLSDKMPIQVSRANADLAKPPVGETKLIRWKAKDGLEIEGLLTYPVGYEQGQKYPLILNIHGGPAGVFSESYVGRFATYPIASFASRGYAVLRPNPRGSGGYGKKFRFANLNDWGGNDYQDLMTGVDHVIGIGLADPERMAVMGWSYGGFMTSWVITQTKRFKAAAVGAGVTNLWSFTGTADIPGFLPDYFDGEPWDAFENYRKHSPVSFVKGVTTPTLILHGEADVRVPVSQGYEFYSALKRQGVTTKMVVYPRTPHGPREPKFILDIAERHLDWVEKYVR